MDLYHVVSWPRQAAAEPHPCLVLLHGRGSNEQDLFGLVPELPKVPLVVSLRAPFSMDWGGYMWYEITDQRAVPDPATFAQSLGAIKGFLEGLPQRYPVDPTRIFVIGFSQGALMAGSVTVAHPELVAAAVMLSGYLPPSDALAPGEALAGKPFFVAHGTDDPVLPVVLARQARLFLEGLRATVDYHEYSMEHQVIEPELRDLRAWLARVAGLTA